MTGEVDQSPKHSDGIILDLSNRSYDYRSADTPPALAINSVVYGNSGRCLETYTVTNFWFVSNTCYKNVLDLPVKTDASIAVNNSHDGYIVNNLVVAASASHPCYSEENKAEEIRYFANLCFGSSNLLRHSNSPPFISDDPLFARPPDLHANASQETPSPHLLADGLALLPRSPALSKGIDPNVLPRIVQRSRRRLEKRASTRTSPESRLGTEPRRFHFAS